MKVVTLDIPEELMQRVRELHELTKDLVNGNGKQVGYTNVETLMVDLIDDAVDVWIDKWSDDKANLVAD